MGEYWGATADPNYGYSPYSGQLHYGSRPPTQIPFTSPPGPGNPLTVEAVARKIRNMHPEQMAALADQWQNAWTFLADIRSFVVQQSTVLQDEHWQSPAARDAFLRKGPGEALTYLDVWMDAAQKNVTALRHLVNVSLDARRDVDLLVQRYERELREAQNVGFLENLGSFATSGVSWNAAAAEEVEQDQAEIRERYRREAQLLAQRYGDQYFDYIAVVAAGVGPPVQPLNAVLSQPAAVVPPNLPGQTGPGQTPPGFVTAPVANQPGQPGQNQPGQNQPGPGQPPNGALPPGVQLPAPVQPGPPGALPPGVPPPGVPLPVPGTQPPGTLPPGTLPPGSSPPGALPAPGTLPPVQAGPPPGTLPPGTLPPGTLPPGTLPPGTVPPAVVPPAVVPPGATGPNGTPLIPPTTVRPPLPGQFGRPGRGPGAVPPAGSAPPPGRSLRRPTGPAGAPEPSGGREIRRSGGPLLVPPPQPGNRRERPATTAVPQQPGRTGNRPAPPPGATGERADRRALPPSPQQTGRPGERALPPVLPQTGRPGERADRRALPPSPPETGRPGDRADRRAVPPVPPQTGWPGERGRARPTDPHRPTGVRAGSDPTFGLSGNAAPPVLKNPTGDRERRPGSAEELRPPAAAGRTEPSRPGGAAPPVLNRPNSPAGPNATPPRTPRRDRRGPAWADWMGTEEARAGAGAGVLDAPQRGRTEEGARGLRSRAATRPESPTEPNRPGTVAPELGKRRTGGEPIPVREADDLVTDEQAFGVRTPGGGVVTGRAEDEAPESEIRPAFRDRRQSPDRS